MASGMAWLRGKRQGHAGGTIGRLRGDADSITVRLENPFVNLRKLEPFQKFCSRLVRPSGSGLFGFWLRFRSVTGHCGHAPSLKPCQKPKILAPGGYRIFLIALGAMAWVLAGCAMCGKEKGFVSLFDGQSLKGWTYVGEPGGEYFVSNNVIVCPANSKGNLLTDGEYSDFVVRLEYKLTHDGNNGFTIR